MWTHWSATPIRTLRPTPQPELPTDKPKGLWISDESDEQSWSAWCRDEAFCDLSSMVRHDVTLHDDANILRLSSTAALLAFTKRYEAPCRYVTTSFRIDWREVSQEYAGITITPYVWESRLTLAWYYGWDCASGCIWDPAAIASVVVA